MYQKFRSDRALARLARAARATSFRRSGSSIRAAAVSASATSCGVGVGVFERVARAPSAGVPGSGIGPTENRSFAGAGSASRDASRSRMSADMRSSSNAHVADVVAMWRVPSRPIRSGHAWRATASPTASGQADVIAASGTASRLQPRLSSRSTSFPIRSISAPCRVSRRGPGPARQEVPRR